MSEWISEDMTFCLDKCNYKKCSRHPSNIKHREIPHSYAELKGTELCELIKEEPDTEVVSNSVGSAKPIHTRYIAKSNGRMMHFAWCGVCGKYKQKVALGDRYCRNCGTKIDWSEGYKA